VSIDIAAAFAFWPPAADIAAAVNAGRSTALVETQRALDRIAAFDGEVNAFTSVDPADAARRARGVDARIARGEKLRLAGVPVAIKDNIWVEGRPITQGSQLFKDFVAPADAIAVARLIEAGAVVVGIANTSEFAAKGQTTNLLHGATRNPWNLAMTPGGSSGGPVAAVAAGMVPLAIGTDAGGSTRRPPAHTGLVGFKPSFGAIPYGPGFEEPFFGISCICPTARTVGEAALAFEIMAGRSAADPHAMTIEADTAFDPSQVRIAYSPKWGLNVPVEPTVAALVEDRIAKLRAAGFTIVDGDPDWPEGVTETGLAAIQQSGLAALYGEAWTRQPALIDPDLGTQIASGLKLAGIDVARALLLSEQVAIAGAKFFSANGFDAAIGPTTPCAAWPVEKLGPETIAGVPVGPRGHAAFTPLFNHTRQPAISIPCGLDPSGLPLGLQLVMPRGCDRRLLRLASAIEAALANPV
jgi:aspartyl-tRNA(Asn)/glutamyl-tRNA(Gln) amidotransferase subunit A